MSVNLIKQPRRKTYDIRVFLSKHKKYKYINTYCTTEREAKKILKKYQTIDIEYNLGLRESQLPTEPVPSLGEGVEKYLEYLKGNADYSIETCKRQTFALDDFVKVFGYTTKIDELCVKDSDRFVNYLQTKKRKAGAFIGKVGLSENSQNISKRIVTTFMNWCINNRKWFETTSFKLKQTRPPEKVKLITPDQFEKILASESNEYLRSYYKLSWSCGLRRKEVNSTELFEDINGVSCLLVTETKGRNKVERDVPIPKENIDDWMMVQIAQYKLDRISRGFLRACRNASLYVPYETTFHTLRHSYATLKIVEGTHLLELSKLLGHTSTQTTEKYANASREMLVKLQRENNNYVEA